jgi:cell division protein FtsQ
VLGVVGFVVLAAGVVAVAGVRSYLMHNARFVLATSDEIQITGAEHLTRDQILSVFGADLERNIFRVSLAERQADLERLPWVAHATVMRLLPDVLRVQITERTPVAFVRQGSQIGLVDRSGVLLDMPADAAGDPHYSFPVLTGLTADEAASERAAKMEVYEQFMHELDGSGQHLTDSVSEVDVADPEDVKALITSGSSDILVHFGEEKFLSRYQEFEQHLGEWKQQYPKLASADMRYDEQIVLEMQGDGAAASGGTATVQSASASPVKAVPTVEAKPAVAQAVPVKAPVQKPAVLTAAATKALVVRPQPAIASVPKPGVVKPDFSHAAMPKASMQQPVVLNGAAPKAGASKAVAAPKLVAAKGSHAAAAKKVVAKRVIGKPRPGSGVDAANEKVFARLAAQHRAELAKEHKTGAGRLSPKSGVTP